MERFRLLHNMLSSQPMCFNLFGPLVHDLALATQVFQAVPELEVNRVLAVELEFAPVPVEEYLADGTSFDAYVEYAHRDGSLAFVGIETKLTDGFSRKVCDTPAYRRWMQGPRAPWRRDAASRVADVEHNQLWRDHLLAVAMRDRAVCFLVSSTPLSRSIRRGAVRGPRAMRVESRSSERIRREGSSRACTRG